VQVNSEPEQAKSYHPGVVNFLDPVSHSHVLIDSPAAELQMRLIFLNFMALFKHATNWILATSCRFTYYSEITL
jgi:hypothetical protein